MDMNRTCSSQFTINNLPKDQREYLMKKDVREKICQFADVDITIRGRYIAPNCSSSVGGGRPLHLHITSRSKLNLSKAAKKIQSLLDEFTEKEVTDSVEDDTCLEEKITVGIEVFPSIFCMKSKILGEKAENVQYIAKETGAVISLHGKGSGNPARQNEPLFVLVKYKDVESKGRTRQLVINLIETVQQEFSESYGKYYARPKLPEVIPIQPQVKVNKKVTPPKTEITPPKKVSDSSTNNIEKITLGLSHIPVKFNLKSRIYGSNLSNVKHIEKVSGAVLLVEGVNSGPEGEKIDSTDSPYILVKYLKPEMKEMARGLILNLIETIHQEYAALYGAFLAKPQTPEIIPVKGASKFPTPSETSVSPKIPEVNRDPLPNNTIPQISENVDRSSPNIGPVPPPPPVISKPINPDDFIKFCMSRPTNGVNANKKLFNDPEPVENTYVETSKPHIPFEPQNIQPIPSIVPSVARINSQMISSEPVQPLAPRPMFLPPDTNYLPLPAPTKMLFPLDDNLQYFKKRSNSPIDVCRELKKFCNPPNNDVVPSIVHIQSLTVQREPIMPSKAKTPPGRYLVPLPKVNSIPESAPAPKPAPQPEPAVYAAPAIVSAPASTFPAPKKSRKGRVRWSLGEKAAAAATKLVATNVEKRIVDDAVFSFLNQCNKAAGVNFKPASAATSSSYNVESDDDDDGNGDSKSVILIDSDEESFLADGQREKGASVSRVVPIATATRSIAVQTDETLRKSNTKCACGRYTRALTIIRSVGVQAPARSNDKF